jgi:glycosyltransferase involved in cell wall biosynthesis
MIRIGVCLRTWGEKGGIGVYSRSLLEALLPLDSENQYFLFYQNRAHVGQFGHYKNVAEVHIPASSKLIWDQVNVPLYAAREKVDILLHPKLAIPLLAKCKTVMVLHGTERFIYPEFSHKSDILYFKTLYPFYLRRATAIISVSEKARQDVIRFLNIDPRKVRTIHLAPVKHFRKIEDDSLLQSIRGKYGLPKRFVLNVGLIYPGKNIPNLLRALKLVRENADIDLVIAGVGKRMYQDDLMMIDELALQDHVLLPGYIPHEDLVGVYNLAEAVVFPSFYESFPAIPLEANACGCPVVTSRTGGTPEAAGEAALYVDPHSVDEIAAAIRRVMTDSRLRKDLIEKGYQNVKRFSWDRTARQTLDLFEALVKE